MSIPSISNISRKNVLSRFHTLQNINTQYDLRKPLISQNNNINKNLYPNLLSGNYNNHINPSILLIVLNYWKFI